MYIAPPKVITNYFEDLPIPVQTKGRLDLALNILYYANVH